MKLNFGKEQIYTSQRMRQSTLMAKVVHKFFGYTNIGNYARFTIFKQILNELPIENFKKVMDLGCGYGEYSFALARRFPKMNVLALDIDASRCEVVKNVKEKINLKNLEVLNQDCSKSTLDEFDFIFSIDVFEHIAENEMPFQDAYKKLRQEGYLLVKIPSKTQRTILPEHLFEEHNDWLEDEHIGQVYDLNDLAHRMENEGFKVISKAQTDGVLSRFAWELSYLAKKMGLFTHLLFLPISKLLIQLDRLVFDGKKGNAIHVLAQKI